MCYTKCDLKNEEGKKNNDSFIESLWMVKTDKIVISNGSGVVFVNILAKNVYHVKVFEGIDFSIK